MLAAGYVAGYLSRFQQCCCHGGIVYGFVTWSLSLILSALLIFPLLKYSIAYKDFLAHTVATKTIVLEHMNLETSSKAKQILTDLATSKLTTNDLVWSTWILFILSFFGALASCIGACWGMCCKKTNNVEKPKMPAH